MPTNRVTIVPVRVNEAELRVIKALAKQQGIPLATCLRQSAMEKARERGIELPALKKSTRKGF